MPIYDYVCTSCRHRIEVIHRINDTGPRFCPACGEEATMRKALVSPAVHFKGSGWAKKDRSSTSRARSRSAEGSSAGGSAGGDPSDNSPRDGSSRDGGSSGRSSRDGGSSEAAPAPTDAAKAESGTASSTPSPATDD